MLRRILSIQRKTATGEGKNFKKLKTKNGNMELNSLVQWIVIDLGTVTNLYSKLGDIQ